MNKATLLCVSAFLAAACAFGQIFFTNKVQPSDAVKIASRLTAGMKEVDALRFMETNGLPFGYTVGGTLSATCFYPLPDGCRLDLEISIEARNWTNRVLKSASLRSNNVSVLPIKLTNPGGGL